MKSSPQLRFTATIILFFALLSQLAHSYDAGLGNRAANFRGFDIVNRSTIQLDDYFGQWTLLMFFATWCPPCMSELPQILSTTESLVTNNELAVILVSNDISATHTSKRPETESELKRLLTRLDAHYPVIYDGGIYDEVDHWRSIPAIEWGIDGLPNTFLINPEGVIVANNLESQSLDCALACYMQGDYPLLALNNYYTMNPDKSLSIIAEVSNSQRNPIEITLGVYQATWVCNEDNEIVDEIIYQEDNLMSGIVDFDQFGDSFHEFLLPPDPDRHYLLYFLKLTYESETDNCSCNEFRFMTSNDVMLAETEMIDGKWIMMNSPKQQDEIGFKSEQK